ncbi:MAG TPA: L-serine ammonia-lyase, iron-sulfur-dependent, subunit alpha [Clostridia bacterium]|nr:L-serine ammonia-lyase, iron-sulfur-dependent, subunit alpha [Clostridia bacterium]
MNFKNGKELLAICKKEDKSIAEIMIQRETSKFKLREEDVLSKMQETIQVMEESIENGKKDSKLSLTGLIGGEAKALEDYSLKYNTISGKSILNGVISAMAVMEENSRMGRIVAAPTAGSSGILPATIISTARRFSIPDEIVSKAFFTASAIGYIVTNNATVSGAEGGCQAETGTASAMAAAALVELLGGTPEQALSAASFTLKNILGLVCDPVAGLVELPCAKRNALGVSNAMLSADMALAGIETKIPFDEVVEAMYRVGKKMHPDLKETAEGGIADTPTARAFEKNIFK